MAYTDDELPPWATLPSESGRAGVDLVESAEPGDPERVEQAMRWRLVLGRYADERLGQAALEPWRLSEMSDGESASEDTPADAHTEAAAGELTRQESERLDAALAYLYDREHEQRAHRTAAGGPSRGLSIPAWLGEVRELFPREAVTLIEQDALRRYGMTELVTDPSILRQSEPTQELLKAILQFKHLMKGEVLEAARAVVDQVVRDIAARLRVETQAALTGPRRPGGRPPVASFRNIDWKRTIGQNLKHYDLQRRRLLAERFYFHHRSRQRARWTVIVAVDQSGSMMDSLIHSAVMAAIFASLPHVRAHLVLWDTRVVDVSEWVSDPMEVLMGCQLGGGTDLLGALEYCAQLVDEPERTVLVVVSDWYIFDKAAPCLRLAAEIAEAGVRGVGLCALDAEARAAYDRGFAEELAASGWFVAAMTPRRLAEHIGAIIA